jgi:putative transposase
VPHTHSSLVVHCVFSTKDRARLISAERENDLWAYMGGIARANRMKPICIGGVEDHCHILVALPTDLDVAKAVQLIKGGSSKWSREKYSRDFGWQQGYGAFSVSASQQAKTVACIQDQRAHHKKMDFKAEYIALLERHGVEYDSRYVFA